MSLRSAGLYERIRRCGSAFLFMAMTMRSVGDAAFEMIESAPPIPRNSGHYGRRVRLTCAVCLDLDQRRLEGDDCARRADHGFPSGCGLSVRR